MSAIVKVSRSAHQEMSPPNLPGDRVLWRLRQPKMRNCQNQRHVYIQQSLLQGTNGLCFGGRLGFCRAESCCPNISFCPTLKWFPLLQELRKRWMTEGGSAGMGRMVSCWNALTPKRTNISAPQLSYCFIWEFRLCQWAFETRVVQATVIFLGQFNLNLAQYSLQ